MTSGGKWTTFAALVIGIGVVTAWAIRPTPRRPTVMVRVTRIEDNESAFHWRWTFTSDRRWETFHSADQNGEHAIVLERPEDSAGPLGQLLLRAQRPRARTLTYEIDARRLPWATVTGMTSFDLTIKMRGDKGGTPASTSHLSTQFPDGEWSRRFKALRTADGRLELPSRVPLATVNGRTEVLEFP